MIKINISFAALSCMIGLMVTSTYSCRSTSDKQTSEGRPLTELLQQNQSVQYTKKLALDIISTGFNAGDGYREVWIRDYNTFIEAAAEVYAPAELKENLLIFFRMQGDDGNILDGYMPKELVRPEDLDNFYFFDSEPDLAGHKNTVETDQETSLIQAVHKYIQTTRDTGILQEDVLGKSVQDRMFEAIEFLKANRYDTKYGLLWGATTADWGDVQPEHGWGVVLDENTHRAIDIYDNAMLIIALKNLFEMAPETKAEWGEFLQKIEANTRTHLWDKKSQKFKPHVYLEGSPFPLEFNEDTIYYFGGTAIAIEAGLLTKEEVKISLDDMVRRVRKAGAPSIGLTLYPPYPEGYFVNQIMNPEYSYQNGGDWTWFGGRMIQQLVKHGFLQDAYDQLLPMTERVQENEGFYEWYSINNEPRGSGTFRGSAGVLYRAINMLEEAANIINVSLFQTFVLCFH